MNSSAHVSEDQQKKIPIFHRKKNDVKVEKRYRLELSIDSPTAMEMIYALSRVQDYLNKMQNNGRIRVNDTLIDYTLDRYGDHDFRIEEINGKMCYVLQSKMNNENKL